MYFLKKYFLLILLSPIAIYHQALYASDNDTQTAKLSLTENAAASITWYIKCPNETYELQMVQSTQQLVLQHQIGDRITRSDLSSSPLTAYLTQADHYARTSFLCNEHGLNVLAEGFELTQEGHARAFSMSSRIERDGTLSHVKVNEAHADALAIAARTGQTSFKDDSSGLNNLTLGLHQPSLAEEADVSHHLQCADTTYSLKYSYDTRNLIFKSQNQARTIQRHLPDSALAKSLFTPSAYFHIQLTCGTNALNIRIEGLIDREERSIQIRSDQMEIQQDGTITNFHRGTQLESKITFPSKFVVIENSKQSGRSSRLQAKHEALVTPFSRENIQRIDCGDTQYELRQIMMTGKLEVKYRKAYASTILDLSNSSLTKWLRQYPTWTLTSPLCSSKYLRLQLTGYTRSTQGTLNTETTWVNVYTDGRTPVMDKTN